MSISSYCESNPNKLYGVIAVLVISIICLGYYAWKKKCSKESDEILENATNQEPEKENDDSIEPIEPTEPKIEEEEEIEEEDDE